MHMQVKVYMRGGPKTNKLDILTLLYSITYIKNGSEIWLMDPSGFFEKIRFLKVDGSPR